MDGIEANTFFKDADVTAVAMATSDEELVLSALDVALISQTYILDYS